MDLRIKITCRTNLDDYKSEVWPTSLPAVPEKGQLIQARSRRKLAVVQVCWLYDGTLDVELHRWNP